MCSACSIKLAYFALCIYSTRQRLLLIEYASPTSDPCYNRAWVEQNDGRAAYRQDLCASIFKGRSQSSWADSPCEYYARTPNSAFGTRDGSIDCAATEAGITAGSNANKGMSMPLLSFQGGTGTIGCLWAMRAVESDVWSWLPGITADCSVATDREKYRQCGYKTRCSAQNCFTSPTRCCVGELGTISTSCEDFCPKYDNDYLQCTRQCRGFSSGCPRKACAWRSDIGKSIRVVLPHGSHCWMIPPTQTGAHNSLCLGGHCPVARILLWCGDIAAWVCELCVQWTAPTARWGHRATWTRSRRSGVQGSRPSTSTPPTSTRPVPHSWFSGARGLQAVTCKDARPPSFSTPVRLSWRPPPTLQRYVFRFPHFISIIGFVSGMWARCIIMTVIPTVDASSRRIIAPSHAPIRKSAEYIS